MKNFLLASLIAASAVFSVNLPAQAAGITVTTTERVVAPRHHKPQYRHHMVRHHCYTKTVKHHRHGRLIVEKVRVCR
jgi:hypothetical protein